jgi:hypothetical protein
MRSKHDTVREKAAPKRGKEGDDTSWSDANLNEPKNEEHQHDLASIN